MSVVDMLDRRSCEVPAPVREPSMRRNGEERLTPVGAELVGNGVSFRVWAPGHQSVTVVVDPADGSAGASVELSPEPEGYWSATVPELRAGQRYAYVLDGDARRYPDPASRFQPEGPHGPSAIIDPSQFTWTDRTWRGLKLRKQVLYELHVGTFSKAGTWRGAIEHLPHLSDLGVTCLEVMPVSDFPGEFGWGYDGVSLFAPSRLYGTPDDFRAFVDAAHRLSLGVILDVVYNHIGPDGNYLSAFSRHYFTDRYKTDWGEAINYDGPQSGPVREFFVSNASYWIREFHLDGLRLDATQNIYDASAEHVVAELSQAARDAAGERSLLLVAENEEQRTHLVRPVNQGGHGLDALWNDDFHHSAIVALTGQAEAYYSDFRGTPQELISSVKRGYLYQGQTSHWQNKGRGTSTRGTAPARFISFLENHDQVANSARGIRRHRLGDPGQYRALTALMLLGPATPLLFQGQEFSASTPFLYFADHHAELAPLVAAGRRQFLSQFPSLASSEAQQGIPDPAERETFEQCRLDWSERSRNAEMLDLHRDLLRLRREDRVLAQENPDLDGAVLGDRAFVIRFFAENGLDRLLLANLGRDLPLAPAPEPLLAEPEGMAWEVLWSSDSPRYGGLGVPPLEQTGGLRIPRHSALFLGPREREAR